MDGVKTQESVLLKFLSTSSMPLLITQMSYNAAGDVEYIGVAMQGSATSDPAWRIENLSYESDGAGGYRYTGSRFTKSGVKWTLRTGYTYT